MKSTVFYWGQKNCHPCFANSFMSLLSQVPGDCTFLRTYIQKASMLTRQQGHQCCRWMPCRTKPQSSQITVCTGGSFRNLLLMHHGFISMLTVEWSTWTKLWIGLTLGHWVSFKKSAFPFKGTLKFASFRLTGRLIEAQWYTFKYIMF